MIKIRPKEHSKIKRPHFFFEVECAAFEAKVLRAVLTGWDTGVYTAVNLPHRFKWF